MELRDLIFSDERVDIYRFGDKTVRLFKESVRKSSVLHIALTHSRVEETGIKIPTLHEVTVINGRWAIVMDCADGETLEEEMAEHPEKIDQYLDDMLDLQIEIHSKSVPKLSKLKDALSRRINELDCIDDVKRYELLTRLESMPKHTKLCHGNFIPSNIIVGPDGDFVVLNWAKARQGNASADVAHTYLMFAMKDQALADRYLDLFCEKTHTSKKYVQDWLPIVAAARMIDGADEEKEFLSRWIDIASYE